MRANRLGIASTRVEVFVAWDIPDLSGQEANDLHNFYQVPILWAAVISGMGFHEIRNGMSDVGKKLKNGQAYDQASAVPYRIRRGRLEFCLITSTGKRRWCFPKGLIDPGETAIETALKEAEEEAGLHGEICGQPLGNYKYNKWGRSLKVVVMLMRVSDAADLWQESQLRDRQWVDSKRAARLLDRPQLQQFLEAAAERLANGRVRCS